MKFCDSYIGSLRRLVGNTALLVVGPRILVEDSRGRFLLLRRSDNGLWGLPGGSMELGESLIGAVHREAMEEANVTLNDVQVFGISSDPGIESYEFPNGDQVQNIAILVHANLENGPALPNDGEASACRFVSAKSIDRSQFLDMEYSIFEKWRKFKKYSEFQVE